MKGQARFPKNEVEEIRRTLRELRGTPPDRQRQARDRLRRIGFYLDDWQTAGGCPTVAEFDGLLEAGRITLTDAKTEEGTP